MKHRVERECFGRSSLLYFEIDGFLESYSHASILRIWIIPPNKSKAFWEATGTATHEQAGKGVRSFAFMGLDGYFTPAASACLLLQYAPGSCD